MKEDLSINKSHPETTKTRTISNTQRRVHLPAYV